MIFRFSWFYFPSNFSKHFLLFQNRLSLNPNLPFYLSLLRFKTSFSFSILLSFSFFLNLLYSIHSFRHCNNFHHFCMCFSSISFHSSFHSCPTLSLSLSGLPKWKIPDTNRPSGSNHFLSLSISFLDIIRSSGLERERLKTDKLYLQKDIQSRQFLFS